jgi:HEAT repeat-containing protein 5
MQNSPLLDSRIDELLKEALAEPLITLLAHPSHTVRVHASWALRCFCFSTPLRLPKTVLAIMDSLEKDVASLTATTDIHLRTIGHAYGLAALVSIIPERPLYISYDTSAKVLDMAVHLLKRAADHDVQIASIEVEVAWTCIASLMSLGPNSVQPHLSQLLVLWRNALPRPTSKDAASSVGRPASEWMFLLHVRECALGAILCFLQHNRTTVTLDVGRRIASILGNALLFANNFVSQTLEEEPTSPTSGGLSLRSREALLRCRVYECFATLGTSNILESTQSSLLQSTASLFASAEVYSGSSVQAAIASSSGAFTSIWQTSDGYAYGVTSIDPSDMTLDPHEPANADIARNQDQIETSLHNLVGPAFLLQHKT